MYYDVSYYLYIIQIQDVVSAQLEILMLFYAIFIRNHECDR